MGDEDKDRIAKKQLKRITEKLRVAKTGTGSAGAHDPQHSKTEDRNYKGHHRK